jgi:hypothetical protein
LSNSKLKNIKVLTIDSSLKDFEVRALRDDSEEENVAEFEFSQRFYGSLLVSKQHLHLESIPVELRTFAVVAPSKAHVHRGS